MGRDALGELIQSFYGFLSMTNDLSLYGEGVVSAVTSQHEGFACLWGFLPVIPVSSHSSKT